jgi:hypothetical protein
MVYQIIMYRNVVNYWIHVLKWWIALEQKALEFPSFKKKFLPL